MTGSVLRLSQEEMSDALDAIDPVALLAEELVCRATGGAGCEPDGRLCPWRGGCEPDRPSELVLLEGLAGGGRCLLPASGLTACRTAALVALAARELVAPGVVTGAVLGSGCAALSSLAVIGRQLPGLSHVAIWPAGESADEATDEAAAPPKLIDQLDLAGIGWSLATTVADAVFGATLVVSTRASEVQLAVGQLPKGAVLINTTGADLPNDLVDAVDQVYVDDAALLGDNRHRYFMQRYLAGPNTGPARFSWVGCGRYRPIEADFAQLLTGRHAGRTHVDHILLVELLGTRVLDVRLACTLYRTALEHGLGVRLVE